MRRLAPLAAAAFLAACGPRAEKEPNDDFGSATGVRAGAVEGTIARPDDADFYKIEVKSEGQVLTASLGGIRGVDFVVSVFGPDRRELKRFDETATGGDEPVLDVGVGRGPHYVVVSNKDPQGANLEQKYSLELKLWKGTGREREPNDFPQAASPLELPGVTRGHHYPGRNLLSGDTDYLEADWYLMDARQNGLYLLNIELTEAAKVDPVLEIYDLNGYRIKEADSGGTGEGESLRGFGVRGPVQYLLRVRPKAPGSANALAAYEILTELLPYGGKSEFEPNDQRQDATPFGQDAMSALLSPAGDEDWYRIEVPDDLKQVLRLNLSGPEGLDLVLELRDGFGAPLLVMDDSGRGRPEVLTGIGVAKGVYYLVVREKSGRREDGRTPYALTRTLTPHQPGLEYEVNDSTASAQAISVGDGVDGYLAPKGDRDYYQFNVYNRGPVLFEIAGVLNVGLSAALLDQDYEELGSWNAAKAGEALSFEASLDKGTYFLRLSAADPEQNNVRDKYSLRLKAR